MKTSNSQDQRLKEILQKKLDSGKISQDYVDRIMHLIQLDNDMKQQREADPEWCKNNLEYDLRSTDWICAKAQASQSYAQNIYAALCNQTWQRIAVWPILKNQTWSCSWRYAGGIVAEMCKQGDYLDWYCSGGEGIITDQIRQDFYTLGWMPIDEINN